MSDGRTHTTRLSLRSRLFGSWAQTFRLGRHWRLEVEWVAKARYYTVLVYDVRRSDG